MVYSSPLFFPCASVFVCFGGWLVGFLSESAGRLPLRLIFTPPLIPRLTLTCLWVTPVCLRQVLLPGAGPFTPGKTTPLSPGFAPGGHSGAGTTSQRPMNGSWEKSTEGSEKREMPSESHQGRLPGSGVSARPWKTSGYLDDSEQLY